MEREREGGKQREGKETQRAGLRERNSAIETASAKRQHEGGERARRARGLADPWTEENLARFLGVCAPAGVSVELVLGVLTLFFMGFRLWGAGTGRLHP